MGVGLADVVVSYASEDRASVGYIVSMLQSAGFDVWWDKKLEAGSSYDTAIVQQIRDAKCVAVVWTKAAIASDWVRGEASMAIEQNKFVPVRLDAATLLPPFSMKHTIDLQTWLGHPLHPEWWDVVGAVRGKVDPTRRTAIAATDYECRAISSLGHHVHKLKAKDTTGRWAYYFILVPPHREPVFLKAIEGNGTIDMEKYGMVIASSYGETPSEAVKNFLQEKYGFRT